MDKSLKDAYFELNCRSEERNLILKKYIELKRKYKKLKNIKQNNDNSKQNNYVNYSYPKNIDNDEPRGDIVQCNLCNKAI